MNFIIFILSKLLAANHLIIWERTRNFHTNWKSSKLLLEITILVSLPSNIGSDTELILRQRSFKYIMNNRSPRIDPWGTPCINVPQSEKKYLQSPFCAL
jgi:hypothetical protein